MAVMAMFIGCGTDEEEDVSSNNQVVDNNSNDEAVHASTTPFIFKMKPDSMLKQITIIGGEGYNYSVDWGDGTSDSGLTESKKHTYPNDSAYTISISGIYPKTDFNCHYRDKLVSIEQWGDMEWKSMKGAFYDCDNVVFNASDTPNLSHVTDMSNMFEETDNFNEDISSWDVSHVTNMEYMFYHAKAFNQDISSWDVSHITNMHSMFDSAVAFNQNIGSWDVSKVTNMDWMFHYALSFNQDIGSWNVSNVTSMSGIFRSAKMFNQDIGSWDISNVTILSFDNAIEFNQDISSWDLLKMRTISLQNTSLSTDNYDKMLMSWVDSGVEDVGLLVGTTKYSSQAQNAKYRLINQYGWRIADGGLIE